MRELVRKYLENGLTRRDFVKSMVQSGFRDWKSVV